MYSYYLYYSVNRNILFDAIVTCMNKYNIIISTLNPVELLWSNVIVEATLLSKQTVYDRLSLFYLFLWGCSGERKTEHIAQLYVSF